MIYVNLAAKVRSFVGTAKSFFSKFHKLSNFNKAKKSGMHKKNRERFRIPDFFIFHFSLFT